MHASASSRSCHGRSWFRSRISGQTSFQIGNVAAAECCFIYLLDPRVAELRCPLVDPCNGLHQTPKKPHILLHVPHLDGCESEVLPPGFPFPVPEKPIVLLLLV